MSRQQDLIAAGLFLSVGLILFFAFDYSGDYAINDDWGYSPPVRWWVEEGRASLTFWQSMPLITQIMAAIAWTEIFGYSQVALRQLTLVFALLCCAGLYLCARQMRLPFSLSLIAGLLPLASPIFVGVSYTFMTDVSGSTLTVLSVLCFLIAFNADKTDMKAYLAGWFILVLAVLLRQTSLAVPVAVILAEPFARGYSHRRLFRSVLMLGSLMATYAGFNAFLEFNSSVPTVYHSKTTGLFAFLSDILAFRLGALRVTINALLVFALHFGFFIWPLLPLTGIMLWRLGREYVVIATSVAAILAVISLALGLSIPSTSIGNMLTPPGIGPRLIEGAVGNVNRSAWFFTFIAFLSFSTAVLVVIMTVAVDRTSGLLANRKRLGGAVLVLLTALITYSPHTIVYAVLDDRYVMIPSMLLSLLVLGCIDTRKLPENATLASFVLIFAGFITALVMTSDFFRWQDARYALIGRVIESGLASADQIDGGFEYNNLAALLENPDNAVTMNLVDVSGRAVRLTATPKPEDEILLSQPYRQALGIISGEIFAVRSNDGHTPPQ